MLVLQGEQHGSVPCSLFDLLPQLVLKIRPTLCSHHQLELLLPQWPKNFDLKLFEVGSTKTKLPLSISSFDNSF